MQSNFYDAQPDAVRAVFELAAMREPDRDDWTDEAHDRVLAAFAPEHADTIREIADALQWIDRLGYDDARTVLRAYHGSDFRAVHADQVADELSAWLQAETLLKAQLVASLRVAAVA